ADAGVFAAPDPVWGQAVHAAVVLREGAKAEEAELQAFLRTRLAGYKVPRAIGVRAALPRNAAGKLMRRALREKEDDA
ncbi:Long-chain-fatty-acid--CoA ligase, partial [mine drainage metagenome]